MLIRGVTSGKKFMIDLLLEKWITAFKKYGHVVEVFENPTPKEIREFKKAFRFILDSKNKKVYIWDAMGAVHSDGWKHIKNDIGDTRMLYQTGDLLPGTLENKSINIYGSKGIHPKFRKLMRETDWSFASNWLDIETLNVVVGRL